MLVDWRGRPNSISQGIPRTSFSMEKAFSGQICLTGTLDCLLLEIQDAHERLGNSAPEKPAYLFLPTICQLIWHWAPLVWVYVNLERVFRRKHLGEMLVFNGKPSGLSLVWSRNKQENESAALVKCRLERSSFRRSLACS